MRPLPKPFPALLARLQALSLQPARPADGNWPAALPAQPGWWSPEWVSLHGTPAARACDPDCLRRLAEQEARNFFSLAYHGERSFVASLRGLRARRAADGAFADYLDVLIEEEMRHMDMFRQFCDRYAGGLLPDRMIPFPAHGEDPTLDLVVYCQAFLFEEILDHFNVAMARDERLHPLVREIHRVHHVEEARHLAFDRACIQEECARLQATLDANRMAAEQREISDYLERYVACVRGEFCNVDAYRAAGVPEPFAARRAALAGGELWLAQRAALRPARAFLSGLGLLPAAEAA
jgi:hypothetical protein